MQDDDQLLKLMGLDSLQGEARQKALDALNRAMSLKFAGRVSKQLNEKQLDEFERLTADEDNLSGEALTAWLDENVPDYQMILADIAGELKAGAEETREAALSELRTES